MGIQVEIPVGRLEFADPYIIGRNGHFEITALKIEQWGQDDPQGDGAVDVHGIGKRGKPIYGGFRCLRVEDIDALCKAWIDARGGLVILPDDDSVTALVKMCGGVIESVIVGRDLDQYNLEWSEMAGGQSLLLLPTEVGIASAPQQGSEEQ